MGRSLAIILMLQGHFISYTFKDFHEYLHLVRSNSGEVSTLFHIWSYIRGLTAPLFFTITGLVFTYLLLSPEQTLPFFQQKRVKKGIRRGFMLLLIGYILQFKIQYIDELFRGIIYHRLYSFHVLHCIGMGMLIVILLFAVYRVIKKVPFFIILGLAGLCIFIMREIVSNTDHFIPFYAPEIFQNMVKGPNSFFPIIPWVGFILFGGMIGALLRYYSEYLRKKWFPFILIFGAVFILLLGRLLFKFLDIFQILIYDHVKIEFTPNGSLFDWIGMSIFLLGILMLIEQHIRIRYGILLKMGQNTLVIYVLHTIILYGSIFGLGLGRWFRSNLSWEQSLIGAILFIILFALVTKIQPVVEIFIKNNPLRNVFRKSNSLK